MLLADLFVGGVLCTLAAWVIWNASFMARVRAGLSLPALARLVILWHHQIMKSIINSAKKSRGRPPVESEAVNVRMTTPSLKEVDDWRRKQDDLPGRPEAIRRLVELGLKVK